VWQCRAPRRSSSATRRGRLCAPAASTSPKPSRSSGAMKGSPSAAKDGFLVRDRRPAPPAPQPLLVEPVSLDHCSLLELDQVLPRSCREEQRDAVALRVGDPEVDRVAEALLSDPASGPSATRANDETSSQARR
jgi:hypothetical protein